MSVTDTITSETSQTTLLGDSAKPRRGRTILRRCLPLIVVAAVLVVTWVWITSIELDSIEQRTLNTHYIIARIREHLVLSVLAAVLVAVTAIPAGIAVTRSKSRVLNAIVIGIANIGQATPAIGVVILLAIVWKTGFSTGHCLRSCCTRFCPSCTTRLPASHKLMRTCVNLRRAWA